MQYIKKIKPWQWGVILFLSTALLYFAIPPDNPLFNTEYSTIIRDEQGDLLHAYINKEEQWHFPPSEAEIPEKLKEAVISYEDEAFYSHPGIDPSAIARAFYNNLREGEITSGASTLTMQVARMRNPKSRNYFNKLLEIIDALKIELYYSKEEILSLYLNHAPYGGNVIGYQTAAYKFFGKKPEQLTWGEAATLAVLPNAPGLIYPGEPSKLLELKRNSLLKKLFDRGVIEELTYQLASIEPVPDQFITFATDAPHLSRFLKTKYPDQKELNTTINQRIQRISNQIAEKHHSILAPYAIHNLSILIADTQSGAIKAYVGSPDFFDGKHNGQVDGVQAARSSGSILKPFLYALSMDEGLILPQSLIRDLPTYFDGFAPSNANETFQGVATAKEALVSSLNIPAVRLLNAYGIFQFYTFLKMAGVSTLFRSADDYGLPLILGGAEVNMWEMVALYRALANEGLIQNNTLLKDELNQQGKQVMSAGASYLTLEMMKELVRPGSEYYWRRFSNQQQFAWKTGTSFGHKDAWAIGVNPQYTIAVWVGNFNGETNKNLSGASSAGPILFDLLQALPIKQSEKWFTKNEVDFTPKKICSLSGFAATKACTEVDTVDAPYFMKPLRTCDYHETRYFSADGRYQTCSHCWDKLGAIQESVTIYAPDIAYYLRENGQYIEAILGHFPECPRYKSEQSIEIIYPNLDAKLFLPRDYDGKIQEVICKVGNTQAVEKIYWYLNESFLGSTKENHKMAIHFQPGKNNLKVVAENGSEDSRTVFAQLKE